VSYARGRLVNEIYAREMRAREMHTRRYTLVCKVYASICKMHVYEAYAAVGAHLEGTRLGDVRLPHLPGHSARYRDAFVSRRFSNNSLHPYFLTLLHRHIMP
jgi:hypothetical protein